MTTLTQTAPFATEITENSQSKSTNRKGKKYGMIASREGKKPAPPKKKTRLTTEENEQEQTLLQQSRNVNLLKKRLDEKQDEIKRLHTQLSSWREKCLRLEKELKDKHNKKRQFQIPVASSEIDPKLPN